MPQLNVQGAAAPRYAYRPRYVARPRTRSLRAVASVESHPVFALLDAEVRRRLCASGRTLVLEAGDTLVADDCVVFVQDGLLGRAASGLDVCVALAGSGAVLGLEAGLDLPSCGRFVALGPCRVFATPVARLIEGLGRGRVMELCLRQIHGRLKAAEVEAGCSAAHLVPQRFARWLVRLHHTNQEGDILLTQAQVARLMGVQRTSVCAAARHLQSIGAVRFTRGRIVIRDPEALAGAACRCSV